MMSDKENGKGAHSESDENILSLIKAEVTRNQGFKMLMLKYQEKTYWHIRRIVHFHEDANDVIQNTFIKVYRNIDKFKGDSKLYTWIYRIATNESITFLNEKKKKGSFENIEENNIIKNLKSDTYFDGNQAQLFLKNALESLPEKQKLVFNLRYYDEMSYNDMSAVLKTSVGALKASYHHAVKKIEKHLIKAVK